MVGGVKVTFIALLTVPLCLSAVEADKKPLTKAESAKVIEKEIRRVLKKPAGALTAADLEKVRALNFRKTPLLTDVTGLEKLTQLTALNLGGNQLTEVPKRLEKLTQLTRLYLHYNKLTELPEGLEKLTQLKSLRLDDNPALTKAQIAELQKALPKCFIEHNASK